MQLLDVCAAEIMWGQTEIKYAVTECGNNV